MEIRNKLTTGILGFIFKLATVLVLNKLKDILMCNFQVMTMPQATLTLTMPYLIVSISKESRVIYQTVVYDIKE